MNDSIDRTTRANSSQLLRLPLRLVLAAALVLLSIGCERPSMEVEQKGYRGLAIEQVTNPRTAELLILENQAPDPLPPVEAGGPGATAVFKNVQVLQDQDAASFVRLMTAVTEWVSPDQGCSYCHVGGSSNPETDPYANDQFANDGVYTKTVARRMIQMTKYINSKWKDHVGATGVTCYTCHRGQNVPSQIWVHQPEPELRFAGYTAGQNSPRVSVGLTSLPNDPFAAYLEGSEDIRVQSGTALPTGSTRTIKDTEETYAMMVHISESLGVNCTHCHNSRAFSQWEQSSPARSKAWYGIRMVRDLNQEYLAPLADILPVNRKGPEGDAFKVNCETCHRGLPIPLLGNQLVTHYPSLQE
jgi:photosynthetic reaction center cytochrome c subunit